METEGEVLTIQRRSCSVWWGRSTISSPTWMWVTRAASVSLVVSYPVRKLPHWLKTQVPLTLLDWMHIIWPCTSLNYGFGDKLLLLFTSSRSDLFQGSGSDPADPVTVETVWFLLLSVFKSHFVVDRIRNELTKLGPEFPESRHLVWGTHCLWTRSDYLRHGL